MKCWIQADGRIEIGSSEPLTPTEGECVFSVKACGICGSDLPRVFGGASYYYPIVLGHEFAGVVKESTRPELVGRRACIFPILPCGNCEFCKKEQWANCVSYSYYGSRRNGGMQSDLMMKESNLVFLPDSVSMEAGAMVEPSAVCLHAMKKADLKGGETVLVYGAGTIGLLCAMWARALGAAKVLVSDPDETRMAFAKDLGFSAHTGEAADVTVEASGAGEALVSAIGNTRAMGRLLLVGHGKRDVVIPHNVFVQILRKQLTLFGSWNSDFQSTVNDWTDSVSAIADGRITPEALITHRIPLSRADEAFAIIGERREPYNKMMLVMEEE
ncbi:MAG: alcohol dehydrogenase catalytic domain-containing protein [Clostridia bacterium]|nr:alcohol dehydrogenase catalytic domain-containing protein [Clostridia bacterium]